MAQQQRHAAGRLQQIQRLANALLALVDLVQEEDARNAERLEPSQNQLQRADLLLVGLGDDDGAVDRCQHRLRLMREFDGAGAIEEADAPRP